MSRVRGATAMALLVLCTAVLGVVGLAVAPADSPDLPPVITVGLSGRPYDDPNELRKQSRAKRPGVSEMTGLQGERTVVADPIVVRQAGEHDGTRASREAADGTGTAGHGGTSSGQQAASGTGPSGGATGSSTPPTSMSRPSEPPNSPPSTSPPATLRDPTPREGMRDAGEAGGVSPHGGDALGEERTREWGSGAHGD